MMSINKVTFVSMNTQGLSDKSKRRDTLNFLKSKKYAVYFLQDTHFTSKEENYIRSQWGYECFFSNFSSQSRGVAILLNNNFEFKLHKVKRDENGNKIILDITMEGLRLTLINIYGPNRDDPNFYKEIHADIVEYDTPVILAGDFNLVLNPEYDTFNYANINNPKARDSVLDMLIDLSLLDVWRELNIEKRQFTWRRKNPIKQARLDFFLISESLFTDVDEANILPGYNTDHSMISLSFDFGKFHKGKSYWKMNNSLLKDSIYIEEIKNKIESIKQQYLLENHYINVNINDIPLEEMQLSINDQLFFEVLLMEIRGKTISYASYKKKQEENKELKLLQEIENLEKELNINYDILEGKRKELYDLRQKKMEGVKIRSRAKWITEGEKVSKYFCNLENRNFISKSMNNLISNNGDVLKEQANILEETRNFYKHLYSKRLTTNVDLNKLLHNMDIPVLSESLKNKLEGRLTYTELLFCLKKASNNTSPGFDGYTYEFFKFFWKDLGHFMLRAINYGFEKGELSVSQKQGVITCIPKGDKDKQYLKNWRPISLLNTTYKLASACIAERLKKILPCLINEDQTGFISGRYIGENIRLLYDVINYVEKNNMSGLLLLIDFEKAFDSVSWDFLLKVLDFFNFGYSFKTWIEVFYRNIESCVIVNGHLSEWFMLQRGCRQGDPLSPYLFILCAEILAVLIRNEKNITGIKIGDTELRISQYADDTSVLLDGSEKSLKTCLKLLKFYADASGLCINMDKTQVVWIGSKKDSTDKLCKEYKLSWDNSCFKVLGIKFPKKLDEIVEINYRDKIEEIKKLLLNWSKRNLTPLGRITVIKSLALSKITHLMLSLPNPSEKIIKEIQIMFFKYLWQNGPDKIKRSTVIQDYDKGGMRMIDVEHFINGLKLTWIRRLILEKKKYMCILYESYPFIDGCLKFGSSYIKKKIKLVKNNFWRDVLQSLCLYINLQEPISWVEFLKSPLWYNHNIKVGGTSICYKSWYDKGMLLLNDLFDNNGNLMSQEKLQETFSVQTNFLQYQGVVNSVRNYLEKLRFQHFPNKIELPVCPLYLSNILKNQKGCRNIYDSFIKTKACIPNSVKKWQNQINFSAEFQWSKILNLPFKITNDTSLRWLQLRINHRILGTNYLLFKMNISDTESCTFCKEDKETIQHLFFDCTLVSNFWKNLESLLKCKCGLLQLQLLKNDILFGNIKFDIVLNQLLLHAKKYIFHSKVVRSIPTVIGFNKIMLYFYKTEKYIATKEQKVNVFNMRWNIYKKLINSHV